MKLCEVRAKLFYNENNSDKKFKKSSDKEGTEIGAIVRRFFLFSAARVGYRVVQRASLPREHDQPRRVGARTAEALLLLKPSSSSLSSSCGLRPSKPPRRRRSWSEQRLRRNAHQRGSQRTDCPARRPSSGSCSKRADTHEILRCRSKRLPRPRESFPRGSRTAAATRIQYYLKTCDGVNYIHSNEVHPT